MTEQAGSPLKGTLRFVLTSRLQSDSSERRFSQCRHMSSVRFR